MASVNSSEKNFFLTRAHAKYVIEKFSLIVCQFPLEISIFERVERVDEIL